SVTSFEAFLPLSDSILIVASNISTFIKQISHLLVECFQFRLGSYASPERRENPIVVTTKTASFSGSRPVLVTQSEIWQPVMFRGGISFGQCLPLYLPTIESSKLRKRLGIVGEAVIEAVRLEKRTKGPRVLCSTSVRDAVQGTAAAHYIGPPLDAEPGCFELYWPISVLEDSCNMEDAINNRLGEWLQGLAHLYSYFRTDFSVRPHYESYLRLLVASALRKYPSGESALKEKMHAMDPDLLQTAFFPVGGH
ncbi:MAG: hypothetical protein ABSH22_14600, partial [Tepidisphaeraceae bacterium]